MDIRVVSAGLGAEPSHRAPGAGATFRPELPLVSVIVTNHNYGRFLRDAVDSVIAQTYPALECIVVDDGSHDESAAVLDALERAHPALRVLRLPQNGGQAVAMTAGLARADGDYVLFLDADDVLFPNCIAAQIAAHMCSRHAVGFTCCDALQIVDGRAVVARNGNISAAFLRRPIETEAVSSTALAALGDLGFDLPPVSAACVRPIGSGDVGWPWSTTSSMLFRRDALDLVVGARAFAELRIATDNYLAHAVNQLTGSLILDAQLVGYRLHGSNGFNKRPALEGFLCHDRADEHHEPIRRLLLTDIIERFAHFAARINRPERLLHICARLDALDPERRGGSQFRRLLEQHRAELEQVLGRGVVRRWRLRIGAASAIRRTRHAFGL